LGNWVFRNWAIESQSAKFEQFALSITKLLNYPVTQSIKLKRAQKEKAQNILGNRCGEGRFPRRAGHASAGATPDEQEAQQARQT